MPEPKFKYEDYAKTIPADSASRIEKDKFWSREKERWINGHNGLTGYHWFFLTQCLIKNASGEEIRPFWRDVDEDIFNSYELARKERKDILYAKRREVGLTTIFGGAIPICNALIYPGSNSLITSADKDRIKNLFLEKTSVVY